MLNAGASSQIVVVVVVVVVYCCSQLDIAVACEMTVQSKTALKLYSEAARNLEDALTQFSDAATPPKWLKSMCQAPCKTWDYPKLAWTQLSWRYLADIRKCLSPLLHTRTFLLVRVSHLLFVLDRAWSVSEEVISTLHSMAREIKVLKVREKSEYFRWLGEIKVIEVMRKSKCLSVRKSRYI